MQLNQFEIMEQKAFAPTWFMNHLPACRSLFACAVLSAIFFTVPAYAQSIVYQMGWRSAPWPVIISLLVLALLAVGLVVVYNIQKANRETNILKLDAERIYRENVARCELTETESAKLRRLLRHEPSVSPPAIFESVSLFERCVDAEIDEILHSAMPPEERKIESTLLAGIRQKLGFNFLPYEHPLVSTRNISLGQSGSIFGKSSKTPLIQRVVVVENNVFSFRIQYNVQKEEPVNFTRGAAVRFVFARQNDGFYGIVLNIVESDNAGTIVLGHTIDIRRNQLRQYVRIEVSIPLKLRLIKTIDPQKSEVKQGQAVDAKIVDISGGGMGFICPSALKPGDLVSLSYHLGQSAMSGVAGKILRISLQEGKTQTLFRHHVEFSNIEPSRREQIVRFVFERQRQMNQWR